MNISIEKISNGYVVTIGGKKTFFDVPEAICGMTSEWVLEECKRIENITYADIRPELAKYMGMAQQIAAQANLPTPVTNLDKSS